MNKILGLKTEVINIRTLLMNYKKIVPEKQLARFEKDLNLLFENYQYLSEEKELEKMRKLAKTKLNSMIRVYGEVKESETSFDKEFLNEEQIKFNEKIMNDTNEKNDKEDDFDFLDYNKRLEKLKNSDIFDKERIKNAQMEKEEYDEMILKAYKTVEEENNKKKIQEFKDNKKEFVANYKAKLENYVRDLALKKDVSNVDDMLRGYDFEKLAEEILKAEVNSNGKESEKTKENMDDILSSFENILSGNNKTENLFKNFRKNFIYEDLEKRENKEELKTFLNQKLDTISKDEKLSTEEKAKSFIKEQWKAENEIIKDKIDGEIRVNAYGNIEFDFFHQEEEEEKKEESNDGVKTFHWKDGKMVEGKAKKRTTTTYSNWHSGNANPDDMKRHRALLDRQHYSGPLWDGIKPKSIMNDPTVFMDIQNFKTNKEQPLLKLDKEGKHEWEEIVR